MARKSPAPPPVASAPRHSLLTMMAMGLPRLTFEVVAIAQSERQGASYRIDAVVRSVYGGREATDRLWGPKHADLDDAAKGLLHRMVEHLSVFSAPEVDEINRLIAESNAPRPSCEACAKLRDEADGVRRARAQRAALLRVRGVEEIEGITGAEVSVEQVKRDGKAAFVAYLRGAGVDIAGAESRSVDNALAALALEIARDMRERATRVACLQIGGAS